MLFLISSGVVLADTDAEVACWSVDNGFHQFRVSSQHLPLSILLYEMVGLFEISQCCSKSFADIIDTLFLFYCVLLIIGLITVTESCDSFEGGTVTI